MRLNLILFLTGAVLAFTASACSRSSPVLTTGATPTPVPVALATSTQTGSSTQPAETSQALPAGTETARPSNTLTARSATPSPAASASPVQASASSTPAATPTPQCTVLQNLNVRSGPGTAFVDPITSVLTGEVLVPLGFNPNGIPGGAWLFVSTPVGVKGWVSAGSAFVSCNVEFSSLGFVPAPPLPPTATPTQTPTSTATNTAPSPPIVSNPNPNGSCDPPAICEYPQFSSDTLFRVTARVGEDAADGDGIDRVVFSLSDSNGTPIYSYSDPDAAFCFFGGDGPCSSWPVTNGQYTWGFGGPVVQTGTYDLLIQVFPDSDPTTAVGNWFLEGGISVTVP